MIGDGEFNPLALFLSPSLPQFSSEGCGRSKSCLRDPVGCDPGRDPLCFFLSFTPEERTVLFELSGPADGYLSFALSLDKWMVGMTPERLPNKYSITTWSLCGLK